MPVKPFIKRLLILRYKYISQKNFVFLLAILVGLLSGLVSVIIKNITYAIEWMVSTGGRVSENSIYFVLPVIGLLLVYLFAT